MDFGRDFDATKSFFQQFHDLQLAVPRPGVVNNGAVNSTYCNFADQNKNCYLLTSANRNEDSFYGFLLLNCKDTVDALWATDSEILYECTDCNHCYNVRFGENCNHCTESTFIAHCNSVKHCILCINLNNVEYHILNKPCTKEEYVSFLKDIEGSYEKFEQMKQKWIELKKSHPERRENSNLNSEQVLGNNIYNSKNIYYGFDLYTSQDIAYSHDGVDGKDCQDVCFFDGTELCYFSTSLIGYGYRFTIYCRDSFDLTYCDNCHASKHLFGCVGLRNKEYCIFNKQYSKETYESLVPRIIEHMMKTSLEGYSAYTEWGEFFPPMCSPFAYNETIAQDYFPLTKEMIGEYGWKDLLPEAQSSTNVTEIPDSIRDTDVTICKHSLRCEDTEKLYRVIPQELEFYQKHALPIPRKHPDRRLALRLEKRPSRNLYTSECVQCHTSILTPYPNTGYENVLCTACYQERYHK